TGKGYPLGVFSDAFERYLRPAPPLSYAQALQPSQCSIHGGEAHSSDPSHEPSVTNEKSEEPPMSMRVVTDVTAQQPDSERAATTIDIPTGKTLPQCQQCGSFALYQLSVGDTECQTCRHVEKP